MRLINKAEILKRNVNRFIKQMTKGVRRARYDKRALGIPIRTIRNAILVINFHRAKFCILHVLDCKQLTAFCFQKQLSLLIVWVCVLLML